MMTPINTEGREPGDKTRKPEILVMPNDFTEEQKWEVYKMGQDFSVGMLGEIVPMVRTAFVQGYIAGIARERNTASTRETEPTETQEQSRKPEPKPSNNGYQCVCKWYPGNCDYCHDKIIEMT